MARKSVVELTVKEVIASGDRAAVWFENRAPRTSPKPMVAADGVPPPLNRNGGNGQDLPGC